MESIKWIFSGIGSEIIIAVVSLIIGGLAGYRIGINKKNKQIQKAGKDSIQVQNQIEEINNENK